MIILPLQAFLPLAPLPREEQAQGQARGPAPTEAPLGHGGLHHAQPSFSSSLSSPALLLEGQGDRGPAEPR